MSNPTSNVFQIHNSEFTFLGKEYSSELEKGLDFGQIFDNFFKTGGYDNINPHEKNKDEHCVDTLIFYKKTPEHKTVYIGKIIDTIGDVPTGYVLNLFPAGKFIVVTSGWVATEDESHKVANETKKNMQMPNGCIIDDASPYVCIEKMFECPENGHKLERWYPIATA